MRARPGLTCAGLASPLAAATTAGHIAAELEDGSIVAGRHRLPGHLSDTGPLEEEPTSGIDDIGWTVDRLETCAGAVHAPVSRTAATASATAGPLHFLGIRSPTLTVILS